ncbi:hypothetical protein EPYR_00443 [Erwinia pyrifoliae DSM 12163]|nr:hypothetical protein EJP617_15760 [Erwinia sp. Ejp617]CAY72768.1 hypothetical protein EPYR_00443 [Erwinia pyrifoliae DSM 12163]
MSAIKSTPVKYMKKAVALRYRQIVPAIRQGNLKTEDNVIWFHCDGNHIKFISE